MNIKDIRKMSSCTQAEFADKYHIPLQTLKQWESSPDSSSYRQCPEYVRLLLQKDVEHEVIYRMVDSLERYKKEKNIQDLLKTSVPLWR